MKKKLVILGILVLLTGAYLSYLACPFSIGYEQVLQIEDAESQEVVSLPLASGGFTLKFQHSVHLTPVYEVYQVDSHNNMVLTETRFFSLGVGMPFTSEEGVFSNKEGEFCITGLNRKITNIPLRVSPIPDHTVIIDGKPYSLVSFGQPGGLINISTRKKWVFIEKKLL